MDLFGLNRRGFSRFRGNFSVEGLQHALEGVDIGLGGASFFSKESLVQGTPVFIHIKVPDAESFQDLHDFSVEGLVLYSEAQEQSRWPYRIGVKFSRLSEKDKRNLKGYLKSITRYHYDPETESLPSKGEEKRRFTRFSEAAFGSFGTFIIQDIAHDFELCDISLGGVSFFTDQDMEKGSVVLIHVEFSEGGYFEESFNFKVESEILYCTQTLPEEYWRFRIGARFTSMSAYEKECLRSYLETISHYGYAPDEEI